MELTYCEKCKHDTGNVFSEYCRACCFGSKFVPKEIDQKTYSLELDVGSLYPNLLIIDRLNKSFGFQSSVFDHGGYMEVLRKKMKRSKLPEIKKVIFSNPATIVFWADGTKTVVKAQGKERFNKEKGLAMAIAKKALGNEGNYYDVFKEWI